jgi:hypothetical protein
MHREPDQHFDLVCLIASEEVRLGRHNSVHGEALIDAEPAELDVATLWVSRLALIVWPTIFVAVAILWIARLWQ